MLEIQTETLNRFNSQSSDTLKILGHNCKHQQGFVKQKTVALYHFGFKFKFPKRPIIVTAISTSYWKLNQLN